MLHKQNNRADALLSTKQNGDSYVELGLVGKGSDDMYQEVKRLGVESYFTDIKFQEGDKDISLFVEFVDKNDPARTIFIGDRARSELAAGHALGATTIWVRQGKFSDELPKDPTYTPTYTVSSLREIPMLLEQIAKTR